MIDEGDGWGRGSDHSGEGLSCIALKDQGAELCGVSPNDCMIRQEAAFILESEAGKPSIRRTAEEDVAGVVGVFEEGGVGVFAAEAG